MKKVWKKVTALLCVVTCLVGSGCFAAKKQLGEVTVYMPDGAPALAMAQLMHEDTD